MEMHKKYYVRLSEEERQYARDVMEAPGTAPRYRKRANILRMADESVGKPMTQDDIAARCDVSGVMVWNTVRDYCERGMEWTLSCHNGGGKEPLIDGETEARIIALACGEPPDGYARWTVRLLTSKVIELDILPAVSRETIRRTLKK